jgi:hypothetical protein
MKTIRLMFAFLVATAPVAIAGLIPQPVNARLSSSVQSPYDLCFYLEQQQWDQVDAVIKRVPSNYQFDVYKQNTPVMVAIDLYAKRIADKPKSFWQTTAGGAVKMVFGSAMVVLGMATLGGGRGNDYMDPIKSWIRMANEDVNAPEAQRPAVPRVNIPAPENAGVRGGNFAGEAGNQAAHFIHELRQSNVPGQASAALHQISEVADQASKSMRSVKIWGARTLGILSLALGVKFCWEGGQKLKSMLSFHSRSSEIEHFQEVINQLLHREDLNLATQNADGETALSLVRKHMASSMRDREAYQLLADVEQLILIRGA